MLLHRYQHGQLSTMVLRYPNGKEQPILASIEQDAARGPRKITFGNGVITTYDHDRRGHISSIGTVAHDRGVNQAATLYRQRLQRDAVGRIVAIERNGQMERYAYDGFDQLMEARTPHEHRRYAYDLVGNRTAMWEFASAAAATAPLNAPIQELSYQPQSNRLHQVVQGGRAIDWKYDGSGSPTEFGERQFRHGMNRRLEEVKNAGKPVAAYRYNVAGERVLKVVNDQSTYFLYSNSRLSAEVDGQGRLLAHYLYLGHVPVAKVETRHGEDAAGWTSARPRVWQRCWRWLRSLAGLHVDDEPSSPTRLVRLLYVHTDHLGTPQVGTEATQSVAWSMNHMVFGRAAEATGGDANVTLNLRFPGQYFDHETKWHYNYMRDYDPNLGRFVQSDPIGLTGGINTYAYAGGNPLGYMDPWGLYTEVIIWDPVGHGQSSFGHVSANINGQNYSWSPHGWDKTFASVSAYIARQQEFRGGTGYVLDLSFEQEEKIAECLKSAGGQYSATSNNCGTSIQQCLRNAGVPVGQSTLPINIGRKLADLPNLNGTKRYKPEPGEPGPPSLPAMP
jgi:RHS repeat-associated protein